jgi:hypothetical protein
MYGGIGNALSVCLRKNRDAALVSFNPCLCEYTPTFLFQAALDASIEVDSLIWGCDCDLFVLIGTVLEELRAYGRSVTAW